MNSHFGDSYLYAAYIVVFVIHGSYVWSLFSRGRRLQRERRELQQQ